MFTFLLHITSDTIFNKNFFFFFQNKGVDAHFCESVSKSPYGGKPNEKQDPKACQEDQRAREIQEKNVRESNLQQNTDLPQNIVLRQNGFGRQRQIRPKTLSIQSTLFGPQRPKSFCIKRIGLKTNMKKHDEKKQGTTRSVSSRKHVKERKAKLKEMTNTAGNA